MAPAEHSEAYLGRLSEFAELTDNLPSVKKGGANPADIHASDLRYLAENIEKPGAWELLQDFFPPESVDAILGELKLQAPLEEVSSMGGGAVSGMSGKKKKKDQNTIIREVMKLLKERGIVL